MVKGGGLNRKALRLEVRPLRSIWKFVVQLTRTVPPARLRPKRVKAEPAATRQGRWLRR